MKRLAIYLPAILVESALFFDWFTIQQLTTAGGHDARTLGRLQATLVLTYISASFVFGRLSDRPSRRDTILLLSGAAVAASFGAGLAVRTVPHFFAQLVAIGLSTAMFWPALQAKLGAEAEPGELARDLSGYNLSWTVGKGLGLYLAGPAFEVSRRLGFWIAAGAAVLAALLPALSIGGGKAARAVSRGDGAGAAPPISPASPAAPGVTPRPETRPPRASGRRPYLFLGLSSNFLTWGVNALVVGLFPDLGRTLGLTPTQQSLCVGTTVAGQLAAFAFLGRYPLYTYRALPVLGAEVLLLVSLAGLSVLEGFAFLLLALLGAGAALALGFAASIFHSLDYDERVGYRTGVHETVLGLGAFAIPLSAGEIAGLSGSPRSPYFFAFGLVAVGLLAQVAVFRRLTARPAGEALQ